MLLGLYHLRPMIHIHRLLSYIQRFVLYLSYQPEPFALREGYYYPLYGFRDLSGADILM